MKNTLLFRILVFWTFALFGSWVAGISSVMLGIGIILWAALAFWVLGDMATDSASEETVDAPEEVPEEPPKKYFVNRDVVLFMYDGRRIKGRTKDGVSYDSDDNTLVVYNAEVIPPDADTGDAPYAADILDEVIVQVSQISLAGGDNPDRVASSR